MKIILSKDGKVSRPMQVVKEYHSIHGDAVSFTMENGTILDVYNDGRIEGFYNQEKTVFDGIDFRN